MVMVYRLVLLLLVCSHSLAQESNGTDDVTALAQIQNETITSQDLVEYARSNPAMITHLQTASGPMRILNNMIAERLLVLEGERREIPRGGADQAAELAYPLTVRRRLVKACEVPSLAEAEAYYEAHLDEFSTPLFLRLSRIGIASRDRSEAEAETTIRELAQQIGNGAMSFGEAASQYSDDELGKDRQGDIGFLPFDPDNSIMQILKDAPTDELYGPFPQPGIVYMYRVTDRREPIAASFAEVKDQALTAAQQACEQAAFDVVMSELKERYEVEILVDSLRMAPQVN